MVEANTNYQCVSAEQLVTEQQRSGAAQFDVVCSLEVIEHVEDKSVFLGSLAALLRPGGLLFLSTINRTPHSYAVAILGAEVLTQMVPPGTHSWHKFPTPEELKAELNLLELETLDVSGMVFTPIPFSSKMLW